jgi:hypothetical protein
MHNTNNLNYELLMFVETLVFSNDIKGESQ